MRKYYIRVIFNFFYVDEFSGKLLINVHFFESKIIILTLSNKN